MSIQRKVKSVEKLFDRLEAEIHQFKTDSGIKCISGCGKCCTKPDIEASPLEFIPWAFHLFLNGKAEEVLNNLTLRDDPVCMLYQTLSETDSSRGYCSEYKYRGLICRLFGYGAAKDKYGKLRMVTCKIIKESQPEVFQKASDAINTSMPAPVFSEYYTRLSMIDFRLGGTILPINMAMKRALEEVLHYYTYRPFPRGHKKTA